LSEQRYEGPVQSLTVYVGFGMLVVLFVVRCNVLFDGTSLLGTI